MSPASEQRRIVAFAQDQHDDWYAVLACGHSQHMRHKPPFMERPWVLSARGRQATMGVSIPCSRCADMNKDIKTNQNLWNVWARHTYESDFYDADAFRAGKCTLHKPELEALGDVDGKSLLHLQCHFGLDTLSWARRGAKVTGVDFSHEAVTRARTLATEVALEADFIECNVYDLAQHLDQQFDIVFTTTGVLGWLPEVVPWARLAAQFLKPGGTLFVADVHPVVSIFDETAETGVYRMNFPYFERTEPQRYKESGCYAEPGVDIQTDACYWNHGIGEIVSAVLGAGLTLQSFREYPFMAWPHLPWMVERDDGMWELPPGEVEFPLSFSLLANKT